MAKLKMRKGVRVVLKKNNAGDGHITDAAGGHSWYVPWDSGPLVGQTSKQSSVSMKFWTALDAPPPSENESEEDSDGEPDDAGDAEGDELHAIKKARFEAFRKTLMGTSV